MKIITLKSSLLGMLVGALAMAGSVLSLQAQTTQLTGTYVNNFDTGGNTSPFAGSGSVASWIYWYSAPGGNTPMTNDVNTPDPNGGAGAGSLEVYSPFSAADGHGNTNLTSNVFFGTFGNGSGYDFSVLANLLNYDYVSFDIYVGTNQVSPPDSSGGWGTLGVGIITVIAGNDTYEQFGAGSVEIPGSASNGWVNIQVPIDHTLAGITTVPGICFNYNSYGGYPTNDFTFWIGNLTVHYSGAPPPPPTVSLEKPLPGLNVIDSTAGAYDRESIISKATSGYSWVNAAGPVTYSFTITNFPANASSVAAQMFLIEGNPAIPSYETAPDYNESNVVIFAVQGTPKAATSGLQYKVGEPNGNNMIYGNAPYTNAPGSGSANFGSGNFGGVSSSTIYGTWSLTFSQNTNITLTAPDGTTTNFVMNPTDAAAFADGNGFVCMLGSQPNNTSAIGQRVVYSSIQIQGSTTPLDDNFLTDPSLNTNLWNVLAVGPTGVFVVPTNIFTILDWTVPDAGFSPILGTNIQSLASFADLGLSPLGQIGSVVSTLIPQASLPVGNQGYFAMIQRSFTQLQVLLPGETNAPGTALGYVGTPTPVSISTQGLTGTTVTVNACDASWHIISGITDAIQITSSDTAAFLPSNQDMVNGTATFDSSNPFLFQTQGSQTVTATDLTSATVTTPATSAPVTVGP